MKMPHPREIVKYVVNTLVYSVSNTLVEKGITEGNPDFAEDHPWITSAAATAVSTTVQDLSKPTTDKLVDKTFDKIEARKAKKTN